MPFQFVMTVISGDGVGQSVRWVVSDYWATAEDRSLLSEFVLLWLHPAPLSHVARLLHVLKKESSRSVLH